MDYLLEVSSKRRDTEYPPSISLSINESAEAFEYLSYEPYIGLIRHVICSIYVTDDSNEFWHYVVKKDI